MCRCKIGARELQDADFAAGIGSRNREAASIEAVLLVGVYPEVAVLIRVRWRLVSVIHITFSTNETGVSPDSTASRMSKNAGF